MSANALNARGRSFYKDKDTKRKRENKVIYGPTMKTKELISKLLDHEMDEEVFIDTGNGLKKIRCIASMESETIPRHYTAIITE